MQNFFLVGVGGAIGAMARYGLNMHASRVFGTAWPYGTFLANVIGGALMGLLVGMLAHRGDADQEKWRLLLGVGVLGGFTTFSAYSLELVLMIERRAWAQVLAYGLGSAALSIGAVFVGLMIARRVVA
jgi:fluoride exporter